MTKVFIPKRIKVGFQKREGTFTGRLGYIIYFDEKGKLRKETSWQGWRDGKIEPEEYDNTPTSGFTLHTDVKRYNGEWFSSHRTMIRVHDPRDWEFEVTTENLIGILMHTDCLRRGLVGEFVYAWVGKELILLPTNSEEYQNAVKYTEGLSKKVAAKELVPGISYKTKREGDVVYIGKFNWYEYPSKGRYGHSFGQRKEEKVHVFTKDEGKNFFKKNSMEFLSCPNTDVPVSNLAELVDKFNKKSYANKIVRLEFRPTEFNTETKEEQWYGHRLIRTNYWTEASVPGVFRSSSAQVFGSRNANNTYSVEGYNISNEYYDTQGVRQSDGEILELHPTQSRDTWGYSYYHDRHQHYTLEQMKAMKLYDLYVVYENGKSKKVNSLYEFTKESY